MKMCIQNLVFVLAAGTLSTLMYGAGDFEVSKETYNQTLEDILLDAMQSNDLKVVRRIMDQPRIWSSIKNRIHKDNYEYTIKSTGRAIEDLKAAEGNKQLYEKMTHEFENALTIMADLKGAGISFKVIDGYEKLEREVQNLYNTHTDLFNGSAKIKWALGQLDFELEGFDTKINFVKK